MAFDLDNIITEVDCPRCGAVIRVPYQQVRLVASIGCQCGAVLRLHDHTPIAAVQGLIDEANHHARGDGDGSSASSRPD